MDNFINILKVCASHILAEAYSTILLPGKSNLMRRSLEGNLFYNVKKLKFVVRTTPLDHTVTSVPARLRRLAPA